MEKQEIKALLDELNLSVEFKFIPYSQTKDAKEKPKLSDLSLNYKAKVFRNGKEILTSPYSMGIGHCKSYKIVWGKNPTIDEYNAIRNECETGYYPTKGFISTQPVGKKKNEPEAVDLFYCIVSVCDVLFHSDFEDWASSYGYDEDSRKAEKIYNECLAIALKLQNAIGAGSLERLREAYQDY